MLSKKSFFTAFFLTSITCMMMTVAEPRQSVRSNTNPHFENEKPMKPERKTPPTFIEKVISLKPIQLRLKQSLICLARKSKEKFSLLVSQRQSGSLAQEVSIPFLRE